jgi:HAE1 family hydrophobic/amphiphilic exporter-1
MIHNAEEGIAIGVKPEPGANILELTDRVEETVTWLNDNKLKAEKIYIDWAYDQRPYIRGALDLLKRNILIGGVLLVFLRSMSSTVVAASAIPISIIGTFIFMSALGRNLNVVSLAAATE